MFDEFKKFALRGNVIDLAVGVIIGGAFSNIVNALVNDIIMPPLGFIIGRIDFSSFYIDLSGKGYASLADAQHAGAPIIAYGDFLNYVIRFLIVAFAIFILVQQINKLLKHREETASPPVQEVLLREIRDLLKMKSTTS